MLQLLCHKGVHIYEEIHKKNNQFKLNSLLSYMVYRGLGWSCQAALSYEYTSFWLVYPVLALSRGFIYRVSQKKRPTLVLLISQLSRGLEIPSWTFFNSPFRVESKNVYFFIIWWYLDQDIGKILEGRHFKRKHL